jgi:hypothetical protein
VEKLTDSDIPFHKVDVRHKAGLARVFFVYPTLYRVYNIGNNNPVELMDYIEVLEALLGKTAGKELPPLQPGDVPDTYTDA